MADRDVHLGTREAGNLDIRPTGRSVTPVIAAAQGREQLPMPAGAPLSQSLVA